MRHLLKSVHKVDGGLCHFTCALSISACWLEFERSVSFKHVSSLCILCLLFSSRKVMEVCLKEREREKKRNVGASLILKIWNSSGSN